VGNTRFVADQPEYLDIRRHRDLEGRRSDLWYRRAFLAMITAVPVIALFNVFGQQPETVLAANSAASLSLHAPASLRGGLLWSAKFRIFARQELKDAILVLNQGWAEEMAINTIEPSPIGQASRDGRLSFDLGHVPKGHSFVLFVQLQVNPINVGTRDQGVHLYDGKTELLTIDRSVSIFP
jgi:hypothetical protein